MNCGRAQQMISSQRDGALGEADARRLASHLATCEACRAFAALVEGIGAHLRAQPVPAGPTPEAAWIAVQRAIRLASDPAVPQPSRWWAARPWLRWASAAALLVLISVGALMRGGAVRESAPVSVVNMGPATPHATEVLRVSTELADASTMVYEDAETGWTVVWVLPPEDANHARL